MGDGGTFTCDIAFERSLGRALAELPLGGACWRVVEDPGPAGWPVVEFAGHPDDLSKIALALCGGNVEETSA